MKRLSISAVAAVALCAAAIAALPALGEYDRASLAAKEACADYVCVLALF